MNFLCEASSGAAGTQHADWIKTVDPFFFLGAAILLVFAWRQFGVRVGPDRATTRFRYAAGLAFVWVFVLLQYGIAHQVIHRIIHDTPSASPFDRLWIVAAFALLFMYLCLTVLPGLVWLNRRIIRGGQWVTGMCVLPDAVAGLLRDSRYTVPEAHRIRIRKQLKKRGLGDLVISIGESRTPEYAWTKTSSLMLRLNSLSRDRAISALFERLSGPYAGIREKYEKLAYRAATVFRLRRESERSLCEEVDVPDDPTGLAVATMLGGLDPEEEDEAQREVQSWFLEGVRDLRLQMYSLFAKALIFKCGSDNMRRKTMRGLGFDVPAPAQIGVLRYLAAFVLISCTMYAGLFLVGLLTKGTDHRQIALRIAVLIPVVYCLSVVAALWPKGRFAFAQRGLGQRRPLGGYAFSLVLAFVLWIIASSALETLFLYDPEKGLNLEGVLLSRWNALHYVLLSLNITLLTAWLADNRPTNWLKGCVFDGIVGGAFQALVAFGVYGIMVLKGVRLPPLGMLLGMSAFLGAAVCLFVPSLYRSRRDGIN